MRTAKSNAVLSLLIGLPLIIVSRLLPSAFSGKLLLSGIFVLLLGAAMTFYFARRGEAADRLYSDEREEYIGDRAVRFTFYTTAAAINTFWAHYISINGNAGFDYLFWLMVVFWGSFVAANVWLRVKG